jgi:hypothetical protein
VIFCAFSKGYGGLANRCSASNINSLRGIVTEFVTALARKTPLGEPGGACSGQTMRVRQ